MKVKPNELIVYAVATFCMTRDYKHCKLDNRITVIEKGEHSPEAAKEKTLKAIEKEWDSAALGDYSDWLLVAVIIGVQNIFCEYNDHPVSLRRIPHSDCQWN